MKIPAVEERVLSGFQMMYQKTFGCDIVIAQTTDQIKQLQLRRNGGQPTYPFAYAKVTTFASPEAADHYVPRYLIRKGIPVQVGSGENTTWNIRILPAIFSLDITYETNAASGQNSAVWYSKRWLMACRMGMLKFAIEIGRLRLKIGYTGDLTVNFPNERPSPSEEETGYKLQTQLQLKGYMSEMQLAPRGELFTINAEAQFGDGPNGASENWDLQKGDQP